MRQTPLYYLLRLSLVRRVAALHKRNSLRKHRYIAGQNTGHVIIRRECRTLLAYEIRIYDRLLLDARRNIECAVLMMMPMFIFVMVYLCRSHRISTVL